MIITSDYGSFPHSLLSTSKSFPMKIACRKVDLAPDRTVQIWIRSWHGVWTDGRAWEPGNSAAMPAMEKPINWGYICILIYNLVGGLEHEF